MRVIPRAEWGAKLAKSAIANIGPRSLVFRHHSATSPEADEAAHMRYIQQIAFGRGFIDISYSFVIFNSGNVYEGRGWGKLGAHTKDYNDDAWGITFAGNFNNMTLSDAAVNAYRWLILEGKRLGWIPSGPTHREHDEVSATACPGDSVEARRGALDAPYDGGSAPTPPPTPPPPAPPKESERDRIRQLQSLIGTGVDGLWGPNTESACRRNYIGWPQEVRRKGGNTNILNGNRNTALVRWLQTQGRRKNFNMSVDGQVGSETNHLIVVILGQNDSICGPNGFRNAVR